jgi:Uri superfamily endonuclease
VQKITESLSGTYLLEIYAEEDFSIKAKKFEGVNFPKGYYYYSGSAQKNYESRLLRHIRFEKTVYWHIDHLTTIHTNRITKIFLFENAPRETECKVVQDLIKHFNLDEQFTGFGNGDCKTCGTHLLYSPIPIDYNHFISLYQSAVRLIPLSKDIF